MRDFPGPEMTATWLGGVMMMQFLPVCTTCTEARNINIQFCGGICVPIDELKYHSAPFLCATQSFVVWESERGESGSLLHAEKLERSQNEKRMGYNGTAKIMDVMRCNAHQPLYHQPQVHSLSWAAGAAESGWKQRKREKATVATPSEATAHRRSVFHPWYYSRDLSRSLVVVLNVQKEHTSLLHETGSTPAVPACVRGDGVCVLWATTEEEEAFADSAKFPRARIKITRVSFCCPAQEVRSYNK